MAKNISVLIGMGIGSGGLAGASEGKGAYLSSAFQYGRVGVDRGLSLPKMK